MKRRRNGLKDASYDDESVRDIEVANGEQETNTFVERYELKTGTLQLLIPHFIKNREK